MIVQTMEDNPFLNKKKFSSCYTASQRMEDWECLSQKLNTAGGAIKNVKAWQKFWSDKKSEVKKKNRVLKAAKLKTGGGQVVEKELTPLEERILLLIGLDEAEGLSKEESEATPSAFIPSAEECQELEDVPLEPSTSQPTLLTNPSNPLEPSTSQATPTSNLNRIVFKKDWRWKPNRMRTKPIILKADNSKQLIESEKELATALTQCAEALQKQNVLKGEELQILKEDLELKKQALVIEQQEADAFVAIANILNMKFSE